MNDGCTVLLEMREKLTALLADCNELRRLRSLQVAASPFALAPTAAAAQHAAPCESHQGEEARAKIVCEWLQPCRGHIMHKLMEHAHCICNCLRHNALGITWSVIERLDCGDGVSQLYHSSKAIWSAARVTPWLCHAHVLVDRYLHCAGIVSGSRRSLVRSNRSTD